MNNEYIRREDAVGAVEFGITLASAINIETGEWTELFQRENDELREAVERIKDIKPADVAPVVRCDDAVSRKAVKSMTCNHCGRIDCEGEDNCIRMIDVSDLPSVVRYEKMGMWVLHTYMPHKKYCSECGEDSPYNKRWIFCPNCGAKMDGEG